MTIVCFYDQNDNFVYEATVRDEKDAERIAKCDGLKYSVIMEPIK